MGKIAGRFSNLNLKFTRNAALSISFGCNVHGTVQRRYRKSNYLLKLYIQLG